jgi:hypothetical protein
MAVPAPADERESISVRKIANGYLIERSGVKRGKYCSHTEYSPGRPVIAAAKATPVSKRPASKRTARIPHGEVGYLRGH